MLDNSNDCNRCHSNNSSMVGRPLTQTSSPVGILHSINKRSSSTTRRNITLTHSLGMYQGKSSGKHVTASPVFLLYVFSCHCFILSMWCCLLQDTTQCQTPARPSPAASSTTSLLCLNTRVRNWCSREIKAQCAWMLHHWAASYTSHLDITTFLLSPSGLLLHTRGITGKRERESERDGSGEKDPASCSVHKMQRQSAEVRLLPRCL